METKIEKNLNVVRDSIQKACEKSKREKESVRLVAVSKFHPLSFILDAIGAGQFLFGENRVQEAVEKFSNPPKNANLHIIGQLQRNKVKSAVSIPCLSMIESVDRIPLIEELEKECKKTSKKLDILLEIKTGEETKAGFLGEDDVKNALSLFDSGAFPSLRVRGFMTLAPNTRDETKIRDAFRFVRTLRDKMQSEFSSLELNELSMGMSGDFEIAIEEGSTIVRVGTAIFGERS